MQIDEELFEQCRKGDARAWEFLVRRYQHPMFALAFRFTGNREEARDLAQDIFVRVYRNMSCYDSRRPFRSWLYSVARNLCIDSYRRRSRERRRVVSLTSNVDDLHSHAPPPDAAVQSREKSELIQRALEDMGEVSRKAVFLKDIQDLSLREMSDLLGVPVGTVKSRIFRARSELHKAILRLRRGVGVSEDLP